MDSKTEKRLRNAAEEIDGISYGYIRQVVARSIQSVESQPGETWICCNWPDMSSLSARIPTADAPALINRSVSLATHVMASTLVHVQRELELERGPSFDSRLDPERTVQRSLVSMLRGRFDKGVLEATKGAPASSLCNVSCVECESKHHCFKEDARFVGKPRAVNFRYAIGQPVETILGVKGTVIANMQTKGGDMHALIETQDERTFWAMETTLCEPRKMEAR